MARINIDVFDDDERDDRKRHQPRPIIASPAPARVANSGKGGTALLVAIAVLWFIAFVVFRLPGVLRSVDPLIGLAALIVSGCAVGTWSSGRPLPQQLYAVFLWAVVVSVIQAVTGYGPFAIN